MVGNGDETLVGDSYPRARTPDQDQEEAELREKYRGSEGSNYLALSSAKTFNLVPIILELEARKEDLTLNMIEVVKQRFLAELEKAQLLPNFGDVTPEVVNEIHSKASQTDWSDVAALKSLKQLIEQHLRLT